MRRRYRDKNAYLDEPRLDEPGFQHREIVSRLKARRCEYCDDHRHLVEVHQIRSLATLTDPTMDQPWHAIMRKRRRLTFVVCQACHELIHHE